MGGGWGKRGSGVPLAQRVRGDLPPAQDPVGPDCPARHCWVSGAVDAEGVKRPGLLFEWRQVAGPLGGPGDVRRAAAAARGERRLAGRRGVAAGGAAHAAVTVDP